MLAGFDPKLLSGFPPASKIPESPKNGGDHSKASPGSDPNLAALLGWGMPPSGLGSSSTMSRPKPGTVAAALEEKKARNSLDFATFMSGGSNFGLTSSESEPRKPDPFEHQRDRAEQYDNSYSNERGIEKLNNPAMNVSQALKRKSDEDSSDEYSNSKLRRNDDEEESHNNGNGANN
jgi:hypothetical protein